MDLYQKLVRNVLFPLDRWRSGDGAELHYLREFQRTQYLSAAELRELQLRQVERLIEHAYQECPFYRKQFDAVGIVPTDIRTLDDLQALPTLEKRHIQEQRDEMLATNWPRHDFVPDLTGGSTGTPLSFFMSRDRVWSRNAAAWRHNRWAGFDIGDRSATLWGAARDVPQNTLKKRLRNVLIDRHMTLNTAHITEPKLQSFLAALKQYRPKTIVAYANSIAMMARYIKSKQLPAYQPYSIITTAEVLEPAARRLIEEVFGCRVFNRYGCREVSVIASECEAHDGMHVMAEGLYVEVVCGNRPAQPGEAGAVLVTDLLNLAMPLIRYRIGDRAVPAAGSCGCGRGLPRLEGIQGRVTDFLVGSDGRLVSGAALTVVMVAKRPGLGQVQIWQDTPGKILFKIVKRDRASPTQEDLDFLDAQTRLYLGGDVKIEHELVTSLPSESSGKYLFCRSTSTSDFVDLHD